MMHLVGVADLKQLDPEKEEQKWPEIFAANVGQGVQLFLNPTNNRVNIIGLESLKTEPAIKVYNSLGVELNLQMGWENRNQVILDFSLIPSGVYYLTIKDHNGNMVFTEKISVTH